MAKTSDLMGLGMGPVLSDVLGLNPVAVTCAGTLSTTATAISQDFNNLTAASNQTGAILPAVGAGAGTVGALGGAVVCGNSSATGAVVYPPSGATINGAASHTIAQNGTAVYVYYSPTVLFAILSA